MQIEIPGALIREWQLKDGDSFHLNANDRDIWRNLRDTLPYPYTLEDAYAWIEIASEEPRTHFAIIVDNEAAGGIGFKQQNGNHAKSAEIGYWLGKNFWGRGIATAALSAVTEWTFENFD